DVELVAGIDADHAEILDRRLGAIARAARHRDLELVRHPAAPGHLLDLYAEAGRILRSEAAPLGADAGLHGAQRLAVGMARNHPSRVEVGPDCWQILFADTENVDALAAGDLHHRRV